MEKKKYPTYNCPNCNHNEAIVHTSNKKKGFVNDGDLAICDSCGLHGVVIVNDGCADVDYNDYDEV